MDLSTSTNSDVVGNTLRHSESRKAFPLPSTAIRKFFYDLREGFLSYHIWLTLGWKDIRSRYQRSLLGPLWITLSLAITVSLMGFLYGALFHQNLNVYLPYIASGMVIWSLISTTFTESTSVFIKAGGIIRQFRLPLSFHVLRILAKNILIFFHNFAVYVVVALIFKVALTWSFFLFPFALLLLLANSLWVGLLLGAVCARFRDVEPIVTSLVQILFFITPVIWIPSSLGPRAWLSQFNPLTLFMDILRDPLLGQTPPITSWAFVILFTIIGWTLTIFLFSKYRARVAYWI